MLAKLWMTLEDVLTAFADLGAKVLGSSEDSGLLGTGTMRRRSRTLSNTLSETVAMARIKEIT